MYGNNIGIKSYNPRTEQIINNVFNTNIKPLEDISEDISEDILKNIKAKKLTELTEEESLILVNDFFKERILPNFREEFLKEIKKYYDKFSADTEYGFNHDSPENVVVYIREITTQIEWTNPNVNLKELEEEAAIFLYKNVFNENKIHVVNVEVEEGILKKIIFMIKPTDEGSPVISGAHSSEEYHEG